MDSSDSKVYLIEKPIEYETVDLGLPSGTIWMKYWLVDKNNDDLFFQWGDTKGWRLKDVERGKKIFDGENYKYLNFEDYTFNKYVNENGGILETSDDAVLLSTQGKFKMPTKEQIQELRENTTLSYSGYTIQLISKENGERLYIYNTGIFGTDAIIDNAMILSNEYGEYGDFAIALYRNVMSSNNISIGDQYNRGVAPGITLKGVLNQ